MPAVVHTGLARSSMTFYPSNGAALCPGSPLPHASAGGLHRRAPHIGLCKKLMPSLAGDGSLRALTSCSAASGPIGNKASVSGVLKAARKGMESCDSAQGLQLSSPGLAPRDCHQCRVQWLSQVPRCGALYDPDAQSRDAGSLRHRRPVDGDRGLKGSENMHTKP